MKVKLPISVVICSKNNESGIKHTFDSVLQNNPYEIIVVDGKSTDDTIGIAKKYTNKIYFDEGKGLAMARQMGAKLATQPHIAYVDADVVLTDNCLQTMLEELESKNYAAIHAQILGINISDYWSWAEDQQFRLFFNKPGERHRIGTIAAIYRRDAVLKHTFDPFYITSYEDGDLCYRMRIDGNKIGVSSAVAFHAHRATYNVFKAHKIRYGRGTARFFLRHKKISTIFNPIAYAFIGPIRAMVAGKPQLIVYFVLNSLFSIQGILSELMILAKAQTNQI